MVESASKYLSLFRGQKTKAGTSFRKRKCKGPGTNVTLGEEKWVQCGNSRKGERQKDSPPPRF